MKGTTKILILFIGLGFLFSEEKHSSAPTNRDDCPMFYIQGCSDNECYPSTWLDDGECHSVFDCYSADGGDCNGDNEASNVFMDGWVCDDSMCVDNENAANIDCYDMLGAGVNCFGCYYAYDCANECLGTAEDDECGVCEGNGPEDNFDCDGNCIAEIDCNGECGGNGIIDECGVCNGTGIPEGECDCVGSTIDECGICGGDNNWCSAPEAQSATHTLSEDTSTSVALLATDADGDALIFNLASSPSNGTVSLAGNVATYIPNANFNGEDSFMFFVSDETQNSNLATISLVVLPVNDAPFWTFLPDQVEIVAGEIFVYALEATDVDGDDLMYELINIAGAGTATLAGSMLTVQADDEGILEITVIVSDGIMTDEETFILIATEPECAEEYQQGLIDGAGTGDANGDGVLNVVDIVFFVQMIINEE